MRLLPHRGEAMPFEQYERQYPMRLTHLFSYEKLGGWEKFTEYPGGAGFAQLEEWRQEWLQTKRPITQDEVKTGTWKKISERNHTFLVQLLPNRKLSEHAEEHAEKTWGGSWQLVDGVLRMKVGKYELDIVANQKGNQHSGIETKDGQYSAYFTVIHLL